MRITKAFAEPTSFPIVLNYSKNHIGTIFNFSIQPSRSADLNQKKNLA